MPNRCPVDGNVDSKNDPVETTIFQRQPGYRSVKQCRSGPGGRMKEASETPAQTAKEAGSGDRQAQRLLAKEAAAQKAEGR